MVIRNIQQKEFREYLEEKTNKNFYTYYHEYLKSKYDVTIPDLHKFFDEVYSITLVFTDNFSHTPYEVNEYIIQQIHNSDTSSIHEKIKTIIKYVFIKYILALLYENILMDDNGEYILDSQLRNVILGEKTTFYEKINILEREVENEIKNPEGDNYRYWFSDVVINEMYRYLESNEDFTLPDKNIRLKKFFYSEISPSDKNLVEDDEFNSKATEKLIMLEKMGIIDFLRENKDFIGSTNLMSKFLSQITGEKTSTIQPSLSAIINNDLDNKNNPFSRVKTVEKATQKLASLGIKSIK